jgi:Fe-Mn family superoxide dismutase
MRYQLTPIFCRPWTLNGLSLQLIESHYENNYGGDLRRLNAIAENLESLDFANTPAHIVNSLKREELIALNSTLLHELYFASLAFGDGRPTEMLARALTSDFGSVDRWRDEFFAMANALAGGSDWVLLVYVPRDRRLINLYAGDHGQTVAGGIPILALDMYEHVYQIDFGANAKAYVDTFMRNIDWDAVQARYEYASKLEPPRPLVQESSLISRESRWKMSRRCWTRASRSNSSTHVRGTTYPVRRKSSKVRSGATRSACRSGRVNCRNRIR